MDTRILRVVSKATAAAIVVALLSALSGRDLVAQEEGPPADEEAGEEPEPEPVQSQESPPQQPGDPNSGEVETTLRGMGEPEDRAALFDRLEWRGILAFPGSIEFSLHDPESGQGFWVAEGEGRFGISIERYERAENTLLLRFGEESRTLTLEGGGVVGTREPPSAPDAADTGVEGAEPQVGEEPEEPDPELERLHQAWEEAIASSSRLQEIRDRSHELHEAAAENAGELAELEAESADREELLAERAKIRSELRLLESMAVAEARNLPALAGEESEALVTTVRFQLSPHQDDSDGEREQQP